MQSENKKLHMFGHLLLLKECRCSLSAKTSVQPTSYFSAPEFSEHSEETVWFLSTHSIAAKKLKALQGSEDD